MLNRRKFIGGLASLSTLSWREIALAADYPAYYAEHLKDVSDRVKALSKTCADGFWFMTDLHIKANRRRSGELIAELSKRTSLTRVLCGGDLTEAFGKGYATDRGAIDFAVDAYRESWVRPLRAAGCRLYTAKGNHDFTVCHSYDSPETKKLGFTQDGLVTKRLIVDEWTDREIVTNLDDPRACYYYFDNAAAKIRYVVVDTTDTETAGEVPWAVRNGIHEPQFGWLATQAFGSVPDDYGVVVMHHIPVTGLVGSDKEAVMFAPFRRLMEAYQNRGRCEENGRTYDFSSAKGRIILDLTGHHHCEMATFQNGILHVTNPCDAAYMDYIVRSKPWCGELPEKKVETVAEQTFDAVQIDMPRDLVHFTRVGGGQNRAYHLKALSSKAGEALGFCSTLLKGRVKWACYDADAVTNVKHPTNRFVRYVRYHNTRATMTEDGTLHPLAAGEIMVLAMDEHLNKEFFPVTIRC